MQESPLNKPPPAIAELVVGMMITTGYMSLLTAIPLGVLLPLRISREDGWDLTWSAILGVAMTTGIAAIGVLLLFAARIVCRVRWGYCPDLFWSSKDSHGNDHERNNLDSPPLTTSLVRPKK